MCEGESGIITGPVGSWNLGIRSSSGFGTPSLSFSAGFGASRRSLPSPLRCVSRGGWARSRPPRSLSLEDGVKGSTRESERERENGKKCYKSSFLKNIFKKNVHAPKGILFVCYYQATTTISLGLV